MNHKDVRSRIHRIIDNIYFNNEQKKPKDSVRKDSVKDFKQRQRKRQKTQKTWPATLIKIKALAQGFSCEFCEISKNIFSYRTTQVAASGF